MKDTKMTVEIIEPIGMRILFRKDDNRPTTRGGILLPDEAKIPVISGRVVAISAQIDNDPDYPIQQYDKVLVDPTGSIPVDFERDNRLYIIPVDDIVAVLRKSEKPEHERSDPADDHLDEPLEGGLEGG